VRQEYENQDGWLNIPASSSEANTTTGIDRMTALHPLTLPLPLRLQAGPSQPLAFTTQGRFKRTSLRRTFRTSEPRDGSCRGVHAAYTWWEGDAHRWVPGCEGGLEGEGWYGRAAMATEKG
jgi:hypothetical protein